MKHGQMMGDPFHFLLQLDVRSGQKEFRVTGFKHDEIEKAFQAYMYAEQSSPPVNWGDPPSTNVVLVSADSVEALRKAYPNYYGDTEMFVNALRHAIA